MQRGHVQPLGRELIAPELSNGSGVRGAVDTIKSYQALQISWLHQDSASPDLARANASYYAWSTFAMVKALPGERRSSFSSDELDENAQRRRGLSEPWVSKGDVHVEMEMGDAIRDQ